MKRAVAAVLALLLGLVSIARAQPSSSDFIFLICTGQHPEAAKTIYFSIDLKNRKARLDNTATWNIRDVKEDFIVFGRPVEEKFGSLWTLNRVSGDLYQELIHSSGVNFYNYKCERTDRKF
jgi:hypothetical protein